MNLKPCVGPPVVKKTRGILNPKTFLIMRLIIFLTILSCLKVTAHVYAQQISINVKDAPIEKVLDEIKKQSGFSLISEDHLLDNIHNVSFTIKNATVQKALEQCFKGQPVIYEISGKTIFLKAKPQTHSYLRVGIQLLDTIIFGKVTDSIGKPLQGAVIRIKGSNQATKTQLDGSYQIKQQSTDGVLVFSMIGYKTQEFSVAALANNNLNVSLKVAVSSLTAIDIVSTGYQNIPKERATGSFEQIDNKLLNRKVSPNILDRLENVTSGFFTNQNDVSPDTYVIRGRSTILSDASPLIVLNNFPFDGNINDINPNDVESITVLKDAAAASIWGARAGNGVIVITTKTGKTDKPTVQLTSNITFTGKPDLYSLPTISSSDYIDLEKQLFTLGYYQSAEDTNNQNYLFPSFTPVVELLKHKRDGTIDPQTADRQIEALKQYDVKKDLNKYFYQNSVNQQYAFNISGKSQMANYYVSAGYDKGITNLVAESTNRITLRNQNTFQLNKRFSVETALNFIQNTYQTGENLGINTRAGTLHGFYPYAQLVGDNVNALPIYGDYAKAFIDDSNAKGLLNWDDRPLDEINNRVYKTQIRELIANLGLNYNIIQGLNASLKYQYQYSANNVNDNHTKDSYYTRSLINRFTQTNTDGSLTSPIPVGDMIVLQNTDTYSNQVRAQLNYEKQWNGKNEISAIAGWEIKDYKTKGFIQNYYGYDKKGSISKTNLNYLTDYPQYDYGSLAPYMTARIPFQSSIAGTTDRYFSYFANASYTYDSRYIVSGSARTDASNLFGVKANQKQVPLWSAGLAWQIDKETFYNISWLPYIKFRVSYGSQGNVSKRTSAYTTGYYYGISSLNGLPSIEIQTPPNESLRWETIDMLNLGIDFATKSNILSGSIEYYTKKGNDLLGSAPIDPSTGIATGTSGVATYFGNLAGINGRGLDLKLNSTILNSPFSWNANFLYSYAFTKVSAYGSPVSAFGNAYLYDIYINPIVDRNIYDIYAFKWAGLDPTNGNPRGYINGQVSDDATAIYSKTPLSEMSHYPSQPSSYGSLRNTFGYGGFFLSFNISYKFGYYFRKQALRYGSLFDNWTGPGEYSQRWQQPGDELKTNVPSFSYPASTNRDNFYNYSDANILKGDNIRFEDIVASYELNKKQLNGLPFQSVRFSANVTNLGLIWAANKAGVDPNYTYSLTPDKSFTLGVNIIF